MQDYWIVRGDNNYYDGKLQGSSYNAEIATTFKDFQILNSAEHKNIIRRKQNKHSIINKDGG